MKVVPGRSLRYDTIDRSGCFNMRSKADKSAESTTRNQKQKSSKEKNLKVKKRISSEVSVKSPGYP